MFIVSFFVNDPFSLVFIDIFIYFVLANRSFCLFIYGAL